MSVPEDTPFSESSSRRYRRGDTVQDAKYFDLALATPLVFAAQPSREISTVSEHLTETISEQSRAEFPGPQRWEEGYQHELKGEADRILRNFTKTTVDSDFDPPLPPVGPGLDDNLADRLGLGYLDTVTLTLITEESAAPLPVASMRRSLGAGQFARMTSRIGFHSRTASRTREERRRQELRDRVLPSSSSFSPEFYLSHVHADTSLKELQEGMRFLEVELSKRTGQLKTLVKEHFEGFISCKNSIDDVHFRLRRNETQNSGANTTSLKASLALVQTELMNSFSPIMARHDKVEQLKHVAEILKRFQSSFNLPSNIRQLSQNGDYQQVVSEYRRAKSTMAGAEVTIWRSLFEEVKKETTDVCMKINKALEDPLMIAEEAQELVTCIYLLRKEGLEFTYTIEPVQQWLMSVDDYLSLEIDKLTSKHRRQMQLATQLDQKMRRKSMPSPFGEAAKTASSASEISNTKQYTDYVTHLCRLLVEHLPKIWKLRQSPELQAIVETDDDIATSIHKGMDHVDVITNGVMDCFTHRITETLEAMLMSEGLLSPCIFTVLKELRMFASDMKDCPGSCLVMLTDLIHECFDMCVNYLCTFLRQQMASLGEWEDWKIRTGSYCRGHPVTSVPYKLGQAVRDVMEQFGQIKAEQDQWLDGSVEVEFKGLNNAFNECFESFAMAVEGLAAEILGPNEPTTRQSPQMPEISKLLILISNSMYIRQRILPELTAQYSDFIYQDLSDKQNDSLLKQFDNLEETMLQAYIEHIKKITEKSMDATIAMEKESPPLKLSDYRASEQPTEWISVITDTHAELLKYAPSKCDEVMTAMVLHLVKRLKLRIQDLPHLGFLLQMYIDAIFVEYVFKGVEVREVHKAWRSVYERLSNLISAQIRSMKDKEADDPNEDAGMNVLNAFADADLEDVTKLDKKLQKMFKEGVKESIKSMSINLASMRIYKSKEKERNKPSSTSHQ